ncbi:MAG: UpxY family transcription antiterminator, partial [Bacteroidota bacterium]
MTEKKKTWYAVYTKPRWEKKVYALLTEKGMEAYCPLNKVKKKWSDRVKWVDEPLFKSYVFVSIPEDEQTAVRMVSGVVNFVYWLGKPAVIKDKEIALIRSFLNEYTEV